MCLALSTFSLTPSQEAFLWGAKAVPHKPLFGNGREPSMGSSPSILGPEDTFYCALMRLPAPVILSTGQGIPRLCSSAMLR